MKAVRSTDLAWFRNKFDMVATTQPLVTKETNMATDGPVMLGKPRIYPRIKAWLLKIFEFVIQNLKLFAKQCVSHAVGEFLAVSWSRGVHTYSHGHLSRTACNAKPLMISIVWYR